MNTRYHLRHFKTNRQGLTLLEVLAAISIIVLLLAITLPAIQSAREASRRTTCHNNARQLLQALQGYQTALSYFPQSSGFDRFSVFVELLPYLNQANLFREFDRNKSIYSQLDKAILRPAILSCASDPHLSNVATSYNWNMGWPIEAPEFSQGIATGVITNRNEKTRIRPQQIRDGLSNTVCLAEVTPRPRPGASVYQDSGTFEILPVTSLGQRCRDATVILPNAGHASLWTEGGKGETLYDHVLEPNAHVCAYVRTSGSTHNTVITVGVCDGSVRNVNDGIDVELWRGLGTRSGGELHAW